MLRPPSHYGHAHCHLSNMSDPSAPHYCWLPGWDSIGPAGESSLEGNVFPLPAKCFTHWWKCLFYQGKCLSPRGHVHTHEEMFIQQEKCFTSRRLPKHPDRVGWQQPPPPTSSRLPSPKEANFNFVICNQNSKGKWQGNNLAVILLDFFLCRLAFSCSVCLYHRDYTKKKTQEFFPPGCQEHSLEGYNIV